MEADGHAVRAEPQRKNSEKPSPVVGGPAKIDGPVSVAGSADHVENGESDERELSRLIRGILNDADALSKPVGEARWPYLLRMLSRRNVEISQEDFEGIVSETVAAVFVGDPSVRQQIRDADVVSDELEYWKSKYQRMLNRTDWQWEKLKTLSDRFPPIYAFLSGTNVGVQTNKDNVDHVAEEMQCYDVPSEEQESSF